VSSCQPREVFRERWKVLLPPMVPPLCTMKPTADTENVAEALAVWD